MAGRILSDEQHARKQAQPVLLATARPVAAILLGLAADGARRLRRAVVLGPPPVLELVDAEVQQGIRLQGFQFATTAQEPPPALRLRLEAQQPQESGALGYHQAR